MPRRRSTVRTTSGSKLFEHSVPDHDAAVVRKLDNAGAIMLGKTGLHELAYGISSDNPHFGAIRNAPPHEKGIKVAQLRRFFNQAKQLEGMLRNGQPIETVTPRLLELEALAAYAVGRGVEGGQ